MVNPQEEVKPDISIVIRSKNEERFINQTLEAIFQQTLDIPFEVILIDSGSTDRTLEIASSFDVRIFKIETNQFSYGRALNYGASLARGRYLVNLSAHCIPTDSMWMSRLIGALETNRAVVATYGKQLPIKGLNPFEERSLDLIFSVGDDSKSVPPFSNANCAIRKRTWREHPFDEKASFAEDFIWSQTLPKQHEIKFIPEAAVYHTHPLELRYWAKRCYDNGVFVQYLEHVYGLHYNWIKGQGEFRRQNAKWTKIFGMIGRRIARFAATFGFLIRKGYFKYIPLMPVYGALEYYYYKKGLSYGLRIYGGQKRAPS